MFHTVAFSATMTSTNVGGLVTPVVDSTITINGNNLLIPDKINQVFGSFSQQTAASTVTKVQLQTPSLREVFYPSLTPNVLAATPDGVPTIFECFDNPIPLVTNEGLNLYSDASMAAPSGTYGGIVFLSDGPRTPVQKSKIYTMRATTAITLVANTWVNGSFTFDQTLPVGNYDVVGMRAQGTGLLAARLVFVGPSATTRPGCPGNVSGATMDFIAFRQGRLGVWGTFNNITPPSVDCIGATGTTQVFYIDLVPR